MKRTTLVLALLIVGAAAVFGVGMWKDGTYSAQDAEFGHGYKNMVRIVVVNGYIVDAHFDAIPESGDKYKYLASVLGEYGMLQNGGAQAAWYVQADAAAAELIRVQDPAQMMRSNGEVDAISGVSIDVAPQIELAARALRNARR